MCRFPMKNVILSAILLVLLALYTAKAKSPDPANIQDRVRYLKQNLERQLRSKHGREIQPLDGSVAEDNYEYDEDSPVTPILAKDKLIKDDRFKLKRLKTTTTTTTAPAVLSPIVIAQKQAPRAGKDNQPVSKPLEIFYRKSFQGRNKPIPWLHCSEMISPYLHGAKKEMAAPRVIWVKDHVVMRLVQLLSMNTTNLSKDEVYSILYQISKVKIRLWSWSIAAMKMLFNVIVGDTHEQAHTYRKIKKGLTRLFDEWRLDKSNTTRLLLQSRVFRPPCMYHKHTGSSKLVRGSTISRPSSPKAEESSEGDCQNRAHNHGAE